MTGWNGHKKVVGTKISLFADKNGLPADVEFGKGSDNDKKFLPYHRREMRKKGIRVNMKSRKQDFTRKRGPKFKLDWNKYKARFLLERINGWIKKFPFEDKTRIQCSHV